ncbi:AAC(3) family N-acetyltransferase [Kitasatospora sp. NPDC002040]|uniref:aminoglycoside N(3)-acetyltransferase n=1 Tax=Kitasatospora sp. NPDC002040 TaxID=3154661 RepID=UPI003322A457
MADSSGRLHVYSVADLTGHLRELGVQEGETLLVQSSARSIGQVEGGTAGIVAALHAALGPTGTLVVYTATPENSDTSPLAALLTDGLDQEKLRAHRATMPPFDRANTPASPALGRISEEVRTRAGAVRSAHPQTSFTAIGPRAEELMTDHQLESHLGERSPTYRLYQAGARALLVGVPLWCCTAFHLAEYWQPEQVVQRYGCVITDRRGLRQWVHFDGLKLEIRHFEAMGEMLADRLPGLVTGRLGNAGCYLLPIRAGVDTAAEWLLGLPR